MFGWLSGKSKPRLFAEEWLKCQSRDREYQEVVQALTGFRLTPLTPEQKEQLELLKERSSQRILEELIKKHKLSQDEVNQVMTEIVNIMIERIK